PVVESTETAVLTLRAGRQAQKGSPPHTRGALVHLLQLHGHLRITPAYAGSTPPGPWRCQRGSDHPRVRGEHTRYAGDGGSSSGSPPRARGARAHRAHEGAAGGITPACAGSTTRRGWSRTRKSDHPRVRGEHACVVVTATSANGSPPRARGAPGPNRRNKVNLRITPACAGSTRQAVRAGQGRRGSPPRARGAPVAHRLVVPRRRITPACAGSTSSAPRSPRSRWDHPRVRGEHAAAFAATFVALGSPPRARGAHLMTRDYSSPPRKTDSLCAAVQALRLRRVRRHRVLTRQRLPHREPRLFGGVAVLVAVADAAPEVDVAAPVAGLGAAEVPVGGVGGRVVGIQLRLPGVAVDRRAPDPLRGDVDLDPDVAVVQPRARQVPRLERDGVALPVIGRRVPRVQHHPTVPGQDLAEICPRSQRDDVAAVVRRVRSPLDEPVVVVDRERYLGPHFAGTGDVADRQVPGGLEPRADAVPLRVLQLEVALQDEVGAGVGAGVGLGEYVRAGGHPVLALLVATRVGVLRAGRVELVGVPEVFDQWEPAVLDVAYVPLRDALA